MQKKQFLALLAAVLSFYQTAYSQTTDWHKSFSARLNKIPVSLELHRTGNRYSGFYYYDNIQQPLHLTSYDSTAADSAFRLYGFIPGQSADNEIFTLSIHGDSLAGNWQQKEGAQSLPISGKEKKNLLLHFEVITAAGSLPLRPGLTGSPEASYQMISVWPEEKNNTALFIKKKINEAFGSKDSIQEIAQLFLAGKKEFFDGYQLDFQNEADSTILEFPSGYSLSEEQSLLVVYQSRKILSLAQEVYTYAGGAHGNYGTTYIPLDLTTNKLITLAQVITPAGMKNLNQLLEADFRKQYGLKNSEPLTEAGLFDDNIEANGNFYITGKGIGFGYVPYEIGAYALGEITIFLPFTKLSPWLQPAFKKWLQ